MTEPKRREIEFTGERVIPGLVDQDLLNEHVARYAFANRIAAGRSAAPRVLDAGCGSGYGAAELTNAVTVSGVDASGEAVAWAREHYARPGVEFFEGVCESLPFSAASFDMVVAFEVIEHLDRWREMLTEADRVLDPAGVLLVSTPNLEYYAESRANAGANPFHRHEFRYQEFRDALNAVFPHVRIWTQNHSEAIVFAPEQPVVTSGALRSGSPDFAGAHFYFAVCSRSPLPPAEAFVWAPAAGNVLRERERHIALLTDELKKKDRWLQENLEAHSKLQNKHRDLTEELVLQNNWAAGLTRELFLQRARISQLQDEQDGRLSWIADLELEVSRVRTEAGRLQREQALQAERIVELQGELEARLSWVRGLEAQMERLEKESAERTAWAQRSDAELALCREELDRIAGSKWARAGSKLGLIPGIRAGK